MFSVDAEPVPTTEDNSATINKKEEYFHPDKNCGFPVDEYYDAAILYCEADYEEVNNLMEILKNEIVLQNGETPNIDLFDVISPTGEMFSQIEILQKKCSCLIIYLSVAFLKDRSLLYQLNEILVTAVKNQSINLRTGNLMLLLNAPIELPIGLQSLCITKWYKNRDLALRKVKKILEKAQQVRKIRIQNLKATSKTPSESKHPSIYNTFNVIATNVQIGENSVMYGTCFHPEKKESNIGKNQNPELKTMQPNLYSSDVEVKDKKNVAANISGSDIQISAPVLKPISPRPSSTSGSSKGV